MKNQRGQILLITVMVLATILSVVLAASFRSTIETQITKLEEESQKALAAAEAGIEAALKQGNVADIGTLSGLSGFSGSATIENETSPDVITPLLQKDEQYSLYLSTPQGAPDNPNFNQLIPAYNNQPLTICSSSNNVALEITLIKQGPPSSVVRYAINPSSNTIINNATSANNIGDCPAGQNFLFKHQLSSSDIGSNNLLLVIRIIGSESTKIGFRGSVPLPPQGKTVVSQATSPGGATKEVVLFQSYPQIPSDFFVTSF